MTASTSPLAHQPEPGLDVAADRPDLQLNPPATGPFVKLERPPRRPGPHRRAVAELVEPAADEHVPGILALRDREHLKIIGLAGRQVLERMHCQVDLACPQRVAYGAGEHPRAADLGHGVDPDRLWS
jgi:hypothetical protein